METIDKTKLNDSRLFDDIDVFFLEQTDKNNNYDILVVVSGLEKFSEDKTSINMIVPLERFTELSTISTEEEHMCQVCEENICDTSFYSLYGPDTDQSQRLRWDQVHPMNRVESIWVCDSCYTEFSDTIHEEISKSADLVGHFI